MGLYNFWEGKLPEPLNQNRCAVCDEPMKPVNENPALDAFQYVCPNCNPKVIIEISGSLLADTLYEQMRQDSGYRQGLHIEIGSVETKKFGITTSKVGEHFYQQ